MKKLHFEEMKNLKIDDEVIKSPEPLPWLDVFSCIILKKDAVQSALY